MLKNFSSGDISFKTFNGKAKDYSKDIKWKIDTSKTEYLENSSSSTFYHQGDNLEEFYNQQTKIANDYLQVFNDTLKDVEERKENLVTKYQDAMIVGNHVEMSGLSTENGYFYQTPEEYEKKLIREIDSLSCLDENGNYSPALYEKKVLEIQEEVAKNYTPLFEEAFEKTMNMSYLEYQSTLEEINNDILCLKSSKYALQQQAKEYPYLAIASTEDFLAFQEEEKKHPTVVSQESLRIDDTTGKYIGNFNAIALANSVQMGQANSYSAKEILDNIRYDLLTEDDKMMYSYLYEKRGASEANKYIQAIDDRLNKVAAKKEAEQFLKTVMDENGKIDVNALNILQTSKKGVLDGIENFGEGILSVFNTEGKITTNQYAQMYILEALQNSLVLEETYKFSNSMGNMLPAMATSALLTTILSPASASLAGSSLMGASAGGNAKNQALVQGHSLAESYLYGSCIGLSETTLGYFLGKIPGLSKTSGLTLKNLLLEGTEEFSQEWVEAGTRAVLLKEDIDWSKIPNESLESFVMGVLMAGALNGTPELVKSYMEEVNESQKLGLVSTDTQFITNVINKLFKKKNALPQQNSQLYSVDTSNCNEIVKEFIDDTLSHVSIPYDLGVQLEKLYFDEDVIVGIHRTGRVEEADLNQIIQDGLILTGDSGQGEDVNIQNLNLEDNITLYDDENRNVGNYAIFLHGLAEAAYYKAYGEGDAILIYFPKSDLNDVSKVVEYKNNMPYLKKQYILGVIHSSEGTLSAK